MKKMFALVLSLAMTLSLAACGSSNSNDAAADTNTDAASTDGADDTAADTQEPGWWKDSLTTVTEGKLTVATSPDFAPYEFYSIDADGNPVLAGFDMALAQYIADYMGLELEIVPMDFDGTIMELQNKNVDLGMAGYSAEPDREEVMDFSDIYITGGQSFVCLNSNQDKFTSLDDANNPDYQIGAQVGSIQADLAKQYTPDADIIELAKVPYIIAELLSGKMDGAFMETMVAESYAKNYPDLCLALDVPYDSKGSAVGVSKGNAPLLAAVNEAIAAAKADGSFDQYVYEANELAAGNVYEGLLEDSAS